MAALGEPHRAGEPLAWVHAADDGAADAASAAVQRVMTLDQAARVSAPRVVVGADTITG